MVLARKCLLALFLFSAVTAIAEELPTVGDGGETLPVEPVTPFEKFRAAMKWHPDVAGYERFYTSYQSPSSRILAPGSGYDGVCEVRVTRTDGTMYGTGHLLPSGRHVLTAAHLAYDNAGKNIATGAGKVRFDLSTGDSYVDFATTGALSVHPSFNGDEGQTPDLMIVTLNAQAPSVANRKEIYRGSSEVSSQPDIAGFGKSGLGSAGSVTDDGERRGGQNIVDADASKLNGVLAPAGTFATGNMVIMDFDNYTKTNDALGHYGIATQLGVANFQEVSPAPGDSGGPLLINNQIAGVVQGGLGFIGAPDYLPGINSSFGEIAFYTRISPRAAWYDAVVPA